MREILSDVRGQDIYLLRCLVPAHKAYASDSGRVFVYQKGKEILVQRYTFVSPEPRTVAAHAVDRKSPDRQYQNYNT